MTVPSVVKGETENVNEGPLALYQQTSSAIEVFRDLPEPRGRRLASQQCVLERHLHEQRGGGRSPLEVYAGPLTSLRST